MLQSLAGLVSALALAVGLISAAEALLPDNSMAATVRWLICLLLLAMLIAPGAELMESFSGQGEPMTGAGPPKMESELRTGIYSSVLAYIKTHDGFGDAEISLAWKPGQSAHIEKIDIYVSFDIIEADPRVTGIKSALARIYNISSDKIWLHRR